MDLALPPNIPTLETSASNWTWPDNFWCSHNAINPIITSDINPSRRPPHADHLPIISILKLPVARLSAPPLHNYHEANFKKLNETLDTHLKHDSPAAHINTKEEFHTKVNLLINKQWPSMSLKASLAPTPSTGGLRSSQTSKMPTTASAIKPTSSATSLTTQTKSSITQQSTPLWKYWSELSKATGLTGSKMHQ